MEVFVRSHRLVGLMDRFEAAGDGDVNQLRRLLTIDNVDDVDPGGCTALHWASEASRNRLECVKLCLEMGANVNETDDCGLAPLHCASAKGYLDVVRVLLDVGATVDATNCYMYEWTPLYNAIRFGYVDTARLLIDRGGKVSNVKRDRCLPAIPDWVDTFIASRLRCRFAATVIIGIHKYHRTNVTGNNDINVLRSIGKHIWSTRMDDVW
jgi:ankyrin repeat protein